MKNRRVQLRLPRLLFQNFSYIAEPEVRSANKENGRYLKSVLPNMKKRTEKFIRKSRAGHLTRNALPFILGKIAVISLDVTCIYRLLLSGASFHYRAVAASAWNVIFNRTWILHLTFLNVLL